MTVQPLKSLIIQVVYVYAASLIAAESEKVLQNHRQSKKMEDAVSTAFEEPKTKKPKKPRKDISPNA